MTGNESAERIAHLARWPLLVLAALFIPVVVVEYSDSFSPAQQFWAAVTEYVIHGIFAVEFLMRVYLVDNRRQYVRENWYDAAAVIAPPVRFLRPLRERL